MEGTTTYVPEVTDYKENYGTAREPEAKGRPALQRSGPTTGVTVRTAVIAPCRVPGAERGAVWNPFL